MNAPMYELAAKMAIASRMLFASHNSFIMSGSEVGSNGGYEAGDERFHFTISEDLLLDPNDIEIEEMIREGGHAIVYKGLFKNQVPVAVKILQSSYVNIEAKEKFENEVLLLAKMKHENIVKFIGACIEPRMMIVTEIVEGGTLQMVMRNSYPEPLDLKMSLSLALDISQAMEFLHSNGIIHGIVMVTADQKHAKLIDFGIAREVHKGEMTCEVGNYRWIAPEVCSKEHYDHKADLYSFSMVFWMLLTNKMPFREMPLLCIPYHVTQGKRPSLEGIPYELVSIIESCWAQDSNARLEFKEITVLLKKLLSGCSSESHGTILLEEEASENDSKTTYLIQERNCDGVKKPKEKKKRKKVVNMLRPFIKTVKACFSKPNP